MMWLLDGNTGFGARESYLIVTVLYYFLNPFICFVWSLYVDFMIHKNMNHLKKKLVFLLIPLLISVVLTLLSTAYPLFFFFDEQNVYHHAPFFWVMALLSYSYLLYAMIEVLRNRKSLEKKNFLPLLLFVIPPFLGSIVQSLNYGLSIVWVFSTISILIIFINIQNDQLYTDYLTGVFNRRQLDSYLYQQMQSRTQSLGGIMLDLDSFKEMNDIYGHSVGDLALRHLADLLRKTFGKRDFISRYGGDEFVIITDTGTGLNLQLRWTA